MALTRITAPAAPVITLEEARAHLRIDACGSPPEHPDDALIESMVAIAISELDGADGWLGRALINQSWLLTLDRFSRWPGCQFDWLFPSGTTRIYLPLTSPQYSGASPAPDPVTSVTYVDTDGATITMVDGTDYRVVTDHDPMYIEPVYGTSWPATRDTSGAVRIIYEAGYGAAGSDVPAIIRNYMLVRIGQLYEFRELVIAGSTVDEVPHYRDSLENVRMRGYS